MSRAVHFYRGLGFEIVHCGEDHFVCGISGQSPLKVPLAHFPIRHHSGKKIEEFLAMMKMNAMA